MKPLIFRQAYDELHDLLKDFPVDQSELKKYLVDGMKGTIQNDMGRAFKVQIGRFKRFISKKHHPDMIGLNVVMNNIFPQLMAVIDKFTEEEVIAFAENNPHLSIQDFKFTSSSLWDTIVEKFNKTLDTGYFMADNTDLATILNGEINEEILEIKDYVEGKKNEIRTLESLLKRLSGDNPLGTVASNRLKLVKAEIEDKEDYLEKLDNCKRLVEENIKYEFEEDKEDPSAINGKEI